MTRLNSYALTVLIAIGAFVVMAVALDRTSTSVAAECVGGTATATASPTATATATATATVTVTPTASPSPTPTGTTMSSALTGILLGNLPPGDGGYGTFAFCGGTFDELLTTSECPEESAVFFYNKPDGDFAVWIPGSGVAAVNAEIMDIFEDDTIPAGTIFTARCE